MKNNNVLLVILILLVLILIIGGFFYIKNISDKQNEILANISEGNIVNKNTTNNAEENNMNLVAETDKNIDDETEVQVTFNPDKMISTNKFVRYEEDLRDRGTSGINVEVKDGKVFVSTDIEDEGYKLLFSNLELDEINNQEITGFDGSVKETFLAYMGNGDMAPVILFLMEDGTVEYLDSKEMFENETYKSSGKLGDLENIVKFTNITITDLDENGEDLAGAIGVVAIDKNGISYDISNVGEFY